MYTSMHKTEKWWGLRKQVVTTVATVALIGATVLPGLAYAAADDVSYTADEDIYLITNNIRLTVKSGSSASVVTIEDDGTLSVDTDAGDSFVLEAPSNNQLTNHGGHDTCTRHATDAVPY